MSQPTIGPAALAWKISQYPQYWIPLILVFIGVAAGMYFLFPAAMGKPLPDPAEVKAMYISWGETADETSFKEIPHNQYYPYLLESMTGGFKSVKKPGPDLIATIRIDTTGGKSAVVKFFDSQLVTIDGKCYDRAHPYMFLQMVEGTRYDY